MYDDPALLESIKSNSTLAIKPAVLMEINLNDPENIYGVGVYDEAEDADSKNKFTLSDSNIIYFNPFVSTDLAEPIDIQEPLRILANQKKLDMYYSLADCVRQNRPRSGINNVIFFNKRYVDGFVSAERPRYYFASPNDTFKYWTSYSKTVAGEVGLSNSLGPTSSRGYKIRSAIPFVVYTDPVPANRIVIKMQTNLGSEAERQIKDRNGHIITDPLTDRTKASIPKRWSIEYLDEYNNWVTAIQFNETSTRSDGTPIVGPDGHVEISYGLLAPDDFKESFVFIDYLATAGQLPNSGTIGEAYIVGGSQGVTGSLRIWDGTEWIIRVPQYGFKLHESDEDYSHVMDVIVDPLYGSGGENGENPFLEFLWMKGIRIVVKTMTAPTTTFDLIEMSPRLVANITDYTISYDITKTAAFDDESLPIGGVKVSNGTVVLSSRDFAFSSENYISGVSGSVISRWLYPNTKIVFWEGVNDINGVTKYVPIATMYAERWPYVNNAMGDISVTLRNLFYLFENIKVPEVFRQNMTLTGAVSWILDNIGFSNYVFKGFENGNDPVIPFFFVDPEKGVAEVLNELSKATQSMMFFDEYNNFVVMSRDYVFDAEADTDFEFVGNSDADQLSNIVDVSSRERTIFNNGTINYTERYIQRSPATLTQAGNVDRYQQQIYKPVMLWEVANMKATKTKNEAIADMGGYVLSAMALNADIPGTAPAVVNGEIKNNTIDVGENIYWLPRYDGYFFANGEIIRFDAVEYAVPGQNLALVWIENNDQYQRYFGSIPFGGKMYPTGKIRIYTDPVYVEEFGITRVSEIKEHGRGCFGTSIVAHKAKIDPKWLTNSPYQCMRMDSSLLFSPISYPTIDKSIHNIQLNAKNYGKINGSTGKWTTSGTIKNVFAEWYQKEHPVNPDELIGAVQASALVLSGPKQYDDPRNILTLGYKEMDADVVGARVRIIGKEEDGTDRDQSALDGFEFFSFDPTLYGSELSISGGSAVLGVHTDPDKHTGYFFEIITLTSDKNTAFIDQEQIKKITNPDGTEEYDTSEQRAIHNIVFYKTVPATNTQTNTTEIIPIKLWGALGNILVDMGIFVGESRAGVDQNPTVYDLAIETYDNSYKTTRQVDNSLTATEQKTINEYFALKAKYSYSASAWTTYLEFYKKYYTDKYNEWMRILAKMESDDLEVETVVGERVFSLYINGVIVASVTDPEPLPITKKVAFGVRGTTTAMFENLYGVKELNTRQNGQYSGSSIFKDMFDKVTNSKMRNYSLTPFLQKAIGGSNTQTVGDYKIDYEEFGTILRECAYFNIKYDQAYPAMYSKLAPVINNAPVYVTSKYYGGPYSAEFMIFNVTDKAVQLDETTGNYLRILGVTFTQNTTASVTVDDYIKNSKAQQDSMQNEIYASRLKNGERSFTLDNIFIQNYATAYSLMQWLFDKLCKPRQNIGLSVFANPMLQLGDKITASYTEHGGNIVVKSGKQFVVTSINYKRDGNGVSMTVGAVER